VREQLRSVLAQEEELTVKIELTLCSMSVQMCWESEDEKKISTDCIFRKSFPSLLPHINSSSLLYTHTQKEVAFIIAHKANLSSHFRLNLVSPHFRVSHLEINV